MSSKSKDMMIHVEKKCANPICPNTFTQRRYWQRFCSKRCRMYAYFTREFAADQIMRGEEPEPYTPLPTQSELDEMNENAQADAELKSRKRAADDRVRQEMKEEGAEGTLTAWENRYDPKKFTVDDL